MKRIISAICASVMLASCFVLNGSAAGLSRIAVENVKDTSGRNTVAYLYDSDSPKEHKVSVKKLIPSLTGLSAKKNIEWDMKVRSESAPEKRVDVSLRLAMPEGVVKSATDGGLNPEDVLDYYNITVTDEDGDVIYDDSNADYEPTTEVNIPLGTFNTKNGSDVRNYKITISEDTAVNSREYRTAADKADWLIVNSLSGMSADSETQNTVSPRPEATSHPAGSQSPKATLHPAVTLPPAGGQSQASPRPTVSVQDETRETEAPAASHTQAPAEQTAAPAATPTPAAQPKPIVKSASGVITVGAGTYTVGGDIPVGKYTLTGSGIVEQRSSAGVLKTRIALTSDGSGITSYDMELKSGDTVTTADSVTFTPYTAAKPTLTPRPTSTPKPTATPRAARATATPKATSAPSKTNPKTGDSAPLIPVAAAACAALAVIAVIEVKKRKMK